jgi:hypothetical protein
MNQPPMWLSNRLAEDPLAADARLQHLGGDLARAEARHLDRAREIRGRMLDRVLEVGLWNLDRQPDSVVGNSSTCVAIARPIQANSRACR